jgi:hypothetical protein
LILKAVLQGGIGPRVGNAWVSWHLVVVKSNNFLSWSSCSARLCSSPPCVSLPRSSARLSHDRRLNRTTRGRSSNQCRSTVLPPQNIYLFPSCGEDLGWMDELEEDDSIWDANWGIEFRPGLSVSTACFSADLFDNR